MKNEIAMGTAAAIAQLILRQASRLRYIPLYHTGLGTWVTMISLLDESQKRKDVSFDPLCPEIFEIILFGSTARGKKEPDDIDMMIFDNGHFSRLFLPRVMEKRWKRDWYGTINHNLSMLFGLFFSDSAKEIDDMTRDIAVDLHVLPDMFFTSSDFRQKVARHHHDPNFFLNAFANALRYNRETGEFVPVTLEYLEQRFNCDLSDLRQ